MSDRDPHEARIRELLAGAVDPLEPRDSLDSIMARTGPTPLFSRRPWLLGVTGAVVATAATIAAVAVLGGGTPDREPGVASSPGTDAGTPSALPSPSLSASTPSEAATVPVYFAGDTGPGTRLFREFQQVENDPETHIGVTAAVDLALAGSAADPDYRSDWPQGTTAAVDLDGVGAWTVTLSNDGADLRSRPGGMSADDARVAVEQVVRTVLGAGNMTVDTATQPVQILVDGAESATVLGVPVSEPLSPAPDEQVLSPIWVIDPAQGAEVTAGFQVSGLANAFEANVQWELMQGDEVVREGFTSAEEAFRMAPYSFTVEAPPGEYTLVVRDEDPSGGTEGFGPTVDTKDIIVGP